MKHLISIIFVLSLIVYATASSVNSIKYPVLFKIIRIDNKTNRDVYITEKDADNITYEIAQIKANSSASDDILLPFTEDGMHTIFIEVKKKKKKMDYLAPQIAFKYDRLYDTESNKFSFLVGLYTVRSIPVHAWPIITEKKDSYVLQENEFDVVNISLILEGEEFQHSRINIEHVVNSVSFQITSAQKLLESFRKDTVKSVKNIWHTLSKDTQNFIFSLVDDELYEKKIQPALKMLEKEKKLQK